MLGKRELVSNLERALVGMFLHFWNVTPFSIKQSEFKLLIRLYYLKGLKASFKSYKKLKYLSAYQVFLQEELCLELKTNYMNTLEYLDLARSKTVQ